MQFQCRLGTSDGRVLTQVQQGSDEAAVRRDLERQGFHIFEVRPRGLPLNLGLPSLRRRKKLNQQEFLAFNQEISALLRAGLPLLQALELMLERMENESFRQVLTEIRDKVESGWNLSDAFASFGDMFPPLYCSTLKAGERSGELESVLRRFMRYQRLVLDARRRVVSALVYPAVLIGLSIVMLMLMAVFVIPNFSKFYSDLGAELPAITQITLAISFFLRDHILWILLGLLVGGFSFRAWKRTTKGRMVVDRMRLKLPILGTIFRYFSLGEFCRSMSTLLAGGIPLVSALETAIESVSNSFIAHRIQPATDSVREGKTFFASLEKTEQFPHMAVDMVKVGEATGSLDEMLASVADYFDEHVETRMQRLLSLVEPFMLVIMGVIIAVLLISIYLPMFNALGQVGN